MLIECTIQRNGPFTVDVPPDLAPIVFRRAGADGKGPFVAEVTDERHIAALLAIDCYREIKPADVEHRALELAPDLHRQEQIVAKPVKTAEELMRDMNIDEMDMDQLRVVADAANMRGWPKNIKIETARRHVREWLELKHADDLEDLTAGESDAGEDEAGGEGGDEQAGESQ